MTDEIDLQASIFTDYTFSGAVKTLLLWYLKKKSSINFTNMLRDAKQEGTIVIKLFLSNKRISPSMINKSLFISFKPMFETGMGLFFLSTS